MSVLKFGIGGLAALVLAAAVSTASVTPAASQGSYYGQTATQNRDYSRMQSATQRAFKTEKISVKKKKKRKHKHRHKHKHHH